MSDESDLKATIQADIVTHLRVHGPKDWNLIYDRYPETFPDAGKKGTSGERKFFRWVASVQKRYSDHPEENRKAAVKAAKDMVGRNLPAAPPPAYIASAGARAGHNIDFLLVLKDVHDDIELIREFSSKFDENGKRGIKNPIYFDVSIKRRLDLLQTGLNIMREVWDLKLMEDFYAEVISIIADEIAPAEPGIARKVMERLQALNARRGMTPHAGDAMPASF